MEPWLEHFARASFQRSADTAHDLKTPLNVAVLNLELLRMRLRKTGAEDDEKIGIYARAIEAELRRLGRIFDAFFLLSAPPRNEGPAGPVDVVPLMNAGAASAGFAFATSGLVTVICHEARIRQAYTLFFEGAARILAHPAAASELDGSSFAVTASGSTGDPDFELTKIFKFYHTDSEGNPDLSLATARVITETYGGELNATQDRDKVILRLSLPVGAR